MVQLAVAKSHLHPTFITTSAASDEHVKVKERLEPSSPSSVRVHVCVPSLQEVASVRGG